MVKKRYFSTYQLLKDGPCRAGTCPHDGDCTQCPEYGDLREQAACDHDRLLGIKRALERKEMSEKKMSWLKRMTAWLEWQVIKLFA